MLKTTTTPGAKISQLNRGQAGTVGILHFPAAALQPNPGANKETVDVSVELKALSAGSYAVQTYRAGKLANTSTVKLGAGETNRFSVAGVGQTEAVFLRVNRAGP